MPNAYPTMLDLARINAGDTMVGLIEENLNVSPEAMMFPAKTMSGTSYETVHRVSLPGSQFRNVNEGVNTTTSSYVNKLVECFYLDQKMEIDVALAQKDKEGVGHVLALEADGHVQASLQQIGAQVWYGISNDAKGFPGAQAIVDSANVLDAGGTSAGTGSSVYGVRFGEKYCSMVFGNDGMPDIGEWRTQRITRNSKELDAWVNSLQGWVGMQWVNKDAVCRLKDCTADSGKECTDAKLAQLMSQLKWVPDAWFMTRRSRYQIQVARAAGSNTSGNHGLPFGPLPTESNGIPIIVTDNLTNTETLS